MQAAFPPIEPYDCGMLAVGEGHQVYWECCGNPNGQPILFLHGGPGSGCSAGSRRFFDPKRYHIVLFDQRGCGRSTPLANEQNADLRANTTAHLVGDIEQLRQLLGIERWSLLGISWGTTLALAYAQAHPERINGLVLALVSTTSSREVLWLTEGVGRIFPREWHRLASAVPPALKERGLVDAYAALLFDKDPTVRHDAAREWCLWEDAHVSLTPHRTSNPRFPDPEFRLRFARLVTHYWKNAAFFEGEHLLKNSSILNGIPGELIHGRYDVSSPLDIPWRLSQIWTSSRLQILDDLGHGGGEAFVSEVIEALERLHVRCSVA